MKKAALKPSEMHCDAAYPSDFEGFYQSGKPGCIHIRDSSQVNGDCWRRLPSQHRPHVIAQSWRRFNVDPASEIHHGTVFVALNADLQATSHAWKTPLTSALSLSYSCLPEVPTQWREHASAQIEG